MWDIVPTQKMRLVNDRGSASVRARARAKCSVSVGRGCATCVDLAVTDLRQILLAPTKYPLVHEILKLPLVVTVDGELDQLDQ